MCFLFFQEANGGFGFYGYVGAMVDGNGGALTRLYAS